MRESQHKSKLCDHKQKALRVVKDKLERQRQLKIDADVDEVIRIIRGLGVETNEKTSAIHRCGETPRRRSVRWLRSRLITIIVLGVAATTGFVAAYNTNGWGHVTAVRVNPPAEVRRATPMQPEIRAPIAAQAAQLRSAAITTNARQIGVAHKR